jgi:hypothetical protein
VQLLEAASVLVAMNHDAAVDSDSSSPAPSGSSDRNSDGLSSSETSPPPQAEESPVPGAQVERKRFSSNSSVYSQSYQSSVFSEVNGTHSRPYMSHFRQWSASDNARPNTSGTSVTSYTDTDEQHAELAGAMTLLSCSYGSGTPKTGPVMLPADAPPVPPLPAQFLGQKADHLSGSTIRGYNSYVRGHRDMDLDADVDMKEEDERHDSPRERDSDDEEGMFGKMEE